MLVIEDLTMNKEMTKDAMKAVFGGCPSCHGIGNYDRFYNGPWKRTYYNAFLVVIRRGRKKYLGLQRQWTWKRVQTWCRGRLRILGHR